MPKTRPCPKCSARVPEDSRFCQACGTDLTKAQRRPVPQWTYFAAFALVIVLGVGVSVRYLNATRADRAPQAATGTEIPLAGPIPDWLKTADSSIIAEYAWAAEHHDELQYIPCYCGCNSVGHTGNASCYYRWGKDGKILGYDAHALG